ASTTESRPSTYRLTWTSTRSATTTGTLSRSGCSARSFRGFGRWSGGLLDLPKRRVELLPREGISLITAEENLLRPLLGLAWLRQPHLTPRRLRQAAHGPSDAS